jgi:hypothetical protein
MLYSVEENLDLMDSEQVDQIIEELSCWSWRMPRGWSYLNFAFDVVRSLVSAPGSGFGSATVTESGG